MSGRAEVADAEIVGAVAAIEAELLEPPVRRAEAPITLGEEEPGWPASGTEGRSSFERFRKCGRTVQLLQTGAA